MPPIFFLEAHASRFFRAFFTQSFGLWLCALVAAPPKVCSLPGLIDFLCRVFPQHHLTAKRGGHGPLPCIWLAFCDRDAVVEVCSPPPIMGHALPHRGQPEPAAVRPFTSLFLPATPAAPAHGRSSPLCSFVLSLCGSLAGLRRPRRVERGSSVPDKRAHRLARAQPAASTPGGPFTAKKEV